MSQQTFDLELQPNNNNNNFVVCNKNFTSTTKKRRLRKQPWVSVTITLFSHFVWCLLLMLLPLSSLLLLLLKEIVITDFWIEINMQRKLQTTDALSFHVASSMGMYGLYDSSGRRDDMRWQPTFRIRPSVGSWMLELLTN